VGVTCEPPADALCPEELALRVLPLRAIFDLEVVARCNGRLLRAARLIGISGAALSTQMTRMEAALGADVIKAAEGDRRTFELTEYGESLVAALRAALPALESLADSIQQGSRSSAPESRRRYRSRGRPKNPK
jgi:DNA-binding transcriptional LysR family regulator